MKRRDFLKNIPAAGAATVVAGHSVQALASSPFVSALNASLFETDRVLIIVQLAGGNDGLNMVFPLDQMDNMATNRSFLIDENKLLKLSDELALHPSMTGMHDLYKDGKLGVIQSVGYPNFNYSHFRATDIWVTGSDAKEYLDSGWTGRYLNYEYPNFPVGYPNADVPHPLAIRLGARSSQGFMSLGVNYAITLNSNTDPNDPLNLTGNLFTDPIGTGYLAKEIAYIREVQRQTDKYGDVLEEAYQKGVNMTSQYDNLSQRGQDLGNQLRIIARLMNGGLNSRIYWVSTGGFDTHAAQWSVSAEEGLHADLLQGLSEAISAFMDDIKLMGFEERVAGFSFSEFGRRIKANASSGTDHGSALPMFFFGKNIIPGIVGNNPEIPANAATRDNLPMQYDFRSVYASILGDWFCVPDQDLETILLKDFQKLSLVDPSGCVPTGVHEKEQSRRRKRCFGLSESICRFDKN